MLQHRFSKIRKKDISKVLEEASLQLTAEELAEGKEVWMKYDKLSKKNDLFNKIDGPRTQNGP